MTEFKTDVHTKTTYEINFKTDDVLNYELVQEVIRLIIDKRDFRVVTADLLEDKYVDSDKYLRSLIAQGNLLKGFNELVKCCTDIINSSERYIPNLKNTLRKSVAQALKILKAHEPPEDTDNEI